MAWQPVQPGTVEVVVGAVDGLDTLDLRGVVVAEATAAVVVAAGVDVVVAIVIVVGWTQMGTRAHDAREPSPAVFRGLTSQCVRPW